MKNLPERAILKYAKTLNPKYDFVFEYHNGEPFLKLVVDISKMDYNSPNFDEEYRQGLVRDNLSGMAAFVNRPLTKVENICQDVNKFLTLPKLLIRAAFDFKNYEYLEKIEENIKEAIVKTNYKDVPFSFRAEQDWPTAEARFYNWPTTTTKDFLKKLENLTDLKISQNYRVTFTSAQPK